jgi:hypothetical protein
MLNNLAKSLRYARSVVREGMKSVHRSPEWNVVRDTFVATHEACEACGCMEKLQVHHVKPFHLHPELELDESNLISLCMGPNECHLFIGHGDSFRCYNPNVREDAKRFMAASSDDRKKIIGEAREARLKD